jgi:hypothetical protein
VVHLAMHATWHGAFTVVERVERASQWLCNIIVRLIMLNSIIMFSNSMSQCTAGLTAPREVCPYTIQFIYNGSQANCHQAMRLILGT